MVFNNNNLPNNDISPKVNCILNADPLVEFETSTLYLTHSPRLHSIKTLAAAICNYFMIEIIKFRPKDKVLIGSSTF